MRKNFLCASFLVILAASLSSLTALAASDVQVLAIGTNHSYKGSLQSLKFAESDARRFTEAMQTVGLVPSVNATVVTDATIADFRNAFRTAEALAKRSDDPAARKFIFYFSGHSDDRGLHMRDGMITKSELHDRLSGITAHTKVAILDSCFSGAITAKGVEKAPGFELPKVEYDEPSGSVFLSASSGRQLAFESDDLEGSIFTHHLLSGLYGEADGNLDGIVTVDELYQHVYRNTKWQSLNYPTASTQEPEYVAKLQGQGAIVLSFPAKTNSQLKFAEALKGEITIASPKGMQFFKVEKTDGKAKTIQLPVGPYKVSVRDGDKIGEGTVKIEPTRVAYLASRDVTWRRASLDTVKVAKGEMTVVDPDAVWSSPRRRYGAMAGVHSGFADGKIGPFAEFNYRFAYARRGRWEGLIGGALNFHRNEIREMSSASESTEADSSDGYSSSIPLEESDGGTNSALRADRRKAALPENSRTDSVALYAITGAAYRTPWRVVPLAIGVEIGYGQTFHDQREEIGSDGHTGYSPGYLFGLNFDLVLASGRRIGITARSETLVLGDVEGATLPSSKAETIALSTTF